MYDSKTHKYIQVRDCIGKKMVWMKNSRQQAMQFGICDLSIIDKSCLTPRTSCQEGGVASFQFMAKSPIWKSATLFWFKNE